MNTIQAIVCRPGEAPRVIELEPELEVLQTLVGGYIEAVPLDDGVTLWCNEEGLLRGLPFNRHIGGHAIVGVFLLTRVSAEGETTSLADADIKRWLSLLGPESGN